MSVTDVVIVGAGVTGLCAARSLEKAGLRVRVLEARTRVGGRLYGETIDGVTREYGGQWIAPYQTAVIELAEELGLTLYSRHRAGNDVFVRGGERIVHPPHEWPVAETSQAAIEEAVKELAALAADLDAEAPWNHPRAAELDAMSFADWLTATVTDPEAQALMRLQVADAFVAKPAEDFSMLLVVHLFASGTGDVHDLLDADLVLDRRIDGGFHRLAERLSSDLATPVQLGVRVREITHNADAVTVTSDVGEFTARTAVVAIPPNLWQEISITPDLSAAFHTLADTARQGMVFKAQAVYDRPFWREEGLSGTGFGPGEFVHEIYDNSPDDGSKGVLVGFMAGDNARRAATMTQEERGAAAVASFAKYFGESALHPLDYFDYDWSADDLTEGAYVASFPPGVITGAKRTFHTESCPIIFTASEMGGRGFGHVEGAVRSGTAAAEAVLERLGRS